MTKDELIATIQQTARKLGHAPSRRDFLRESGLSMRKVHIHFPRWNEAVKASGLAPDQSKFRIDDVDLLIDWACVVRKLGKMPTIHEYKLNGGKYGSDLLGKRFGGWSNIRVKFMELFKDHAGYSDVISLIPNLPSQAGLTGTGSNSQSLGKQTGGKAASGIGHAKLGQRPIYGNPLQFRGLLHEPVNENGVIFLFGMVARDMDYRVEIVQQGFPDCEAKRKIKDGKWEKVRIEFEFESRNFREHGHSVDDCDIIVCWRHNWPDCPIEILELSSAIKDLKE